MYAIIATVVAGFLLYTLYTKRKQEEQDICKIALMCFGELTIFASAVGVALGAAANSLFLGVMSSTWPAILAGAIIGAIGTMLALLTTTYVFNPIVNKVIECCSKEAPVNQCHI